jgi:OOP family OmpA-OmpF porin
MKTNKKALIGAVLGAAVLGVPAAGMAQQQPNVRGGYIGASAGHVSYAKTCESLAIGCDDSDAGVKLFGGYRFSRNLAVEGAYTNLGTATGNGTISGLAANFDRDVSAWDISMLIGAPISQQFSFFGRLGFMRSETQFKGTLLGASVDVSEKKSSFTYGLGAQMELGKSVAVRAEWQRYTNTGGPGLKPYLTADEVDIDFVSVGLIWKF